MHRGNVLAEALELTTGVRDEMYGHPRDNHERIAAIWSAILDQPITANQVALCMVGVKLARAAHFPYHDDNYVDGAAYFAIACEVAREENV